MFDIAINNGIVIDTKNLKQLSCNIGIKNGKIVAMDKQILTAKTIIDAKNLIISPGFIDVHGHIDGYLYSGELSVSQGITTTIGGNCGLSPVNIDNFFKEQERNGFYINQAELIGHSFSLRKAVGIDNVYSKATKNQIDKMVELAKKGLEDGACGISFGLDYSPGACFDEIVALAHVCAKYNRVMPIHTRLFTQNDLYSLYEVLSIAKRTNVKLLFSHFVYQYGTGIMEDALNIIDKAIANGINIKIDSGMYTDWATFIGTATFDEQTIADNEQVLGSMVVATGKYTGRHLNKELYHLLRNKYPNESVICFEGEKEEIYTALKKSYAMPSTDIGTYAKGEGHPQIAGSFPKFIKEMVCDRHDLTIEEAVAKATIFPAETFGFKNKGILEVGADADITIFDLDRLEDKADFPNKGKPDEKPIGIEYVLVNGEIVIYKSKFINIKPGKVIKI